MLALLLRIGVIKKNLIVKLLLKKLFYVLKLPRGERVNILKHKKCITDATTVNALSTQKKYVVFPSKPR